jgi:Fe-S cluster assembly protein SufD
VSCGPGARRFDPHLGRTKPHPSEEPDLSTFTADAVDALAGPDWLRSRRRSALERFSSTPLPSSSLEEWRYGRIDQLELDRFHPVRAATGRAGGVPAELRELVGSLHPSVVVVVDDGVGTPHVEGDDPGVDVLAAADTVSAVHDVVTPDALVALNEAFATPLVLRVAPGRRPRGPIVVLHHLTAAAAGSATFPLTRVELAERSEAGVVEIAWSADVEALTVPVTELDLADGARAEYLNLQQLGGRVWQLGRQAGRVGRDATLTAASVALGGDYARTRTDCVAAGAGASVRLLAAYFAAGDRTVDFRTTQDHRAPRTTSELLFKGAAANRAHAVYTGLIRVEKGARATNAFQTNRNLVLHAGARADSVPNLEIEDNDVRCSHASAVGPVDPDQRFYLESRGVPPEVADRLITLGFLDEVLARMPFPAALGHVRRALIAELDRAEERERAAHGAGLLEGDGAGVPAGPARRGVA